MNVTTEAPNRGEAAVLPSQPLPSGVVEHPVAQIAAPALPAANMGTYDTLLHMAMNQGADLDRLERLLQMKLQWEANEARKAFIGAMADFKLNPPTILKTKRVYFEARDGKGAPTDYYHATHADVTLPIISGLARHGISHSWVPEQREGNLHITCVLTHRLGHSESIKMIAGADNTGNKSGIQAICSTKTLLERYTLLAITGLSTADMPDDDGRGGGDPGHQHQHHDNGQQHAGNQQTGATDGKRYYDNEAFRKNLPGWHKALNKGKPVDDLFIFVEANGTFFTDAQKKELRDHKPVVPA